MTDPRRGALAETDLLLSRAYVAGEWVRGDRAPIEVDDPFTLDSFGEVPNLGADETNRAIASAQGAASALLTRLFPGGW